MPHTSAWAVCTASVWLAACLIYDTDTSVLGKLEATLPIFVESYCTKCHKSDDFPLFSQLRVTWRYDIIYDYGPIYRTLILVWSWFGLLKLEVLSASSVASVWTWRMLSSLVEWRQGCPSCITRWSAWMIRWHVDVWWFCQFSPFICYVRRIHCRSTSWTSRTETMVGKNAIRRTQNLINRLKRWIRQVITQSLHWKRDQSYKALAVNRSSENSKRHCNQLVKHGEVVPGVKRLIESKRPPKK